MSSIVIINIILGFLGVLIVFALTRYGREKIDELGTWFANLMPSMEISDDFEGLHVNLTQQLFYKYNHETVASWQIWIVGQTKEDQEEALTMLLKHLEGPAKHWGNISSEVIDAIKDFKHLNVFQHLCKFFNRVGKLWDEYKITPSLYLHAAQTLFSIDPSFAYGVFSAELSDRNMIVDPHFLTKAKMLVDFIALDKTYGPSLVVELMNNEDLKTDLKQYAFFKVEGMDEEDQLEVLKKVLQPYIDNPKLITRHSSENSIDFDARKELFKGVIAKIAPFAQRSDVFNLFSDLCGAGRELLDIIHLQAAKRINSPEVDISEAELLAYYYLPDVDNRMKNYLATKAELTQIQLREIIFKPRLAKLTEAKIKDENFSTENIPIPKSLDKQFKKFKALLGKSDTTIFEEGGVVNGILVYGNDRMKKLYFSRAIMAAAKVNFVYCDLSQLETLASIQSLNKRIKELQRPVVIFLDNFEHIAQSDDSDEIGDFLNDLKRITCAKESILMIATPLTDMEIKSDLSFYEKFEFFVKRLTNERIELNSEPGSKDGLISHYSKFVENDDSGKLDLFTEELRAELETNKSDIVYEFDCVEEFSVQLLLYGEVRSLREVKALRSDLLNESEIVKVDDQASIEDGTATESV